MIKQILTPALSTSRWKQRLYAWLGCGYYGTHLTQLHTDQPPATNQRLRLVVLARHHYYETTLTYPVYKTSELKAAIALDQQRLHPWPDAQGFYSIAQSTPGKMQVVYWCIQNTVLDRIRERYPQCRPWLIIPESLLHAQAEDRAQMLTAPQGQWFLYRTAEGLFTSKQAKGIYQDPQVFTSTYQIPIQELRHLSQAEQQQARSDLLIKLPLASLQHLTLLQWPQPQPRTIKAVVSLLLIACLSYLAASSTWLWYQQQQLSAQVAQSRQLVDAQTRQQMALYDQLERYQQNLLPAFQERLGAAQMLSLVFALPDDTQIMQIQHSQAGVELRFNAPSAVAVLQRLRASEQISQAQFSTPVQPVARQEDREQATIVFRFVPHYQAGSASL